MLPTRARRPTLLLVHPLGPVAFPQEQYSCLTEGPLQVSNTGSDLPSLSLCSPSGALSSIRFRIRPLPRFGVQSNIEKTI